jgi:hypothetical protein
LLQTQQKNAESLMIVIDLKQIDLERSETWTAGVTSVFSAFFKLTNSATAIYPCLIMDNSVLGGVYARFDLVNGTVLQGAATTVNATFISSGIEKLPNGWARCWVCGTMPEGGGRASVTIRNNTTTTNGYDPAWTASNTTDGVYVLWPQIEKYAATAAPHPTSTIISTGSFVTRASDLVQTPTTPWINQDQGTFLIDYYRFHNNVSYGSGYTFTCSRDSNNFIGAFDSTNNQAIGRIFVDGSVVSDMTTTNGALVNGKNTIAFSYNREIGSIFVGNGSYNTSNGISYSKNLPTTMSGLTLGNDAAGNFPLCGRGIVSDTSKCAHRGVREHTRIAGITACVGCV